MVVHLPASYHTSGDAYPVLYLLDGTQAFLLEMIAITTRLRNDRNAPEMIIVAIENTNRNRDMMPVVAKDFPGPPRAEAFLGFLETELIPDIEKALTDRYTTGNGLGLGLGGARRLVNEFDISSRVGEGT